MMKILYIFLLFTCTVSAQVPDLLMASYQQTDTGNPELITNGTFDTDTTGWTAVNGTLSIVSGILRMVDAGIWTAVYQPITTQIGTEYIVTFDIIVKGVADSHAGWGNTAPDGASYYAVNDNSYTTIGSKSFTFTATATTTYISFGTQQNNDGRWDNISVLKN